MTVSEKTGRKQGFVQQSALHVFLSGVCGGADCFTLHFVFFPTTQVLSSKWFGVEAVVTWFTAVESGVVNLLAYPFFPGDYG